MKNNCTYFLMAIAFFSCNKSIVEVPLCDEYNPCSENACQPEDCDTTATSDPVIDSIIYGMDVQWIHEDDIQGGINDFFAKGDFVFAASNQSNGFKIHCFEKSSGNLLWIFDEPIVDYFSDIHFHEPSNTLIAQRSSRIVAIEATTGNLISNYQPANYSSSATFGELLGDYYYLPVRSLDQQLGFVLRAHVSDLSSWTEVYSIHTDQVSGSRPSINSMNLWTDPSSGDEILILQHRMAFPRRVDLVAYNMTADSMYWWHKDIEPDGNSNIGQIAIVDGKALFQGSQTLHCYDIKSGNFEWKIQYNGSRNRSYMSAFANIVDMKNGNIIATVKERSQQGFDDKYITQIIDLKNGNIIKELDIHTGYINRVYLNGYLFGSGKERIVEPNSGNVLWNEVDNNNLGVYDILIDKERKIYFGIYGGIVQDDARLMAWDISEFLE